MLRLLSNNWTQHMNDDDEVTVGLTPHETLVDRIMYDIDSATVETINHMAPLVYIL